MVAGEDQRSDLEEGQVRFTGGADELLARDDLLRSIFLRPAGKRSRSKIPNPRPVSADAPPVLQVDAATRSFGGVRAVNGVSLDVPSGAIVGIIGSNGAGKITLFDVCSGFIPPDSGRVHLLGRDVTASSPATGRDWGWGAPSRTRCCSLR